MTDDPYVYPGTTVLINKLGIKNKAELELVERGVTVSREQLPIPGLVLDEIGLRRIHGHLFEPLYEWAGKYRQMNMAVAGVDELGRERKVVFAPRARIEPEMEEVFSCLAAQANLKGTSPDQFAGEAAHVTGRLLQIHPFRDGNGRTTRYFLDRLATQAGHKLQLTIAPYEHVRARWMAASEALLSSYPNYTPMAQLLSDMVRGRVRAHEQRMPIGQAIAEMQQLRPHLILSVSSQLRETHAALGRDPANRDLRERAEQLGKLDKALKRGWPATELGILKAAGVTDLRLDGAVAGAHFERFRVIGEAVERTIAELPAKERQAVLDRLGRDQGLSR